MNIMDVPDPPNGATPLLGDHKVIGTYLFNKKGHIMMDSQLISRVCVEDSQGENLDSHWVLAHLIPCC